MKKLNLELGSIKEMLSKEEMKKVVGGNQYDCFPGEFPCFCGEGNFRGCTDSIGGCIQLCS